jgi:hypothetical protein
MDLTERKVFVGLDPLFPERYTLGLRLAAMLLSIGDSSSGSRLRIFLIV